MAASASPAAAAATLSRAVFIAVALVMGVLIGLLRGGRFASLEGAAIRFGPLLAIGIVVQGAARLTTAGGVALLLISYLLLLAFTGVNAHLTGMGVVAIGIAMNALVIGANGGMPVRQEAVVEAGMAAAQDVPTLEFGSKRHLERSDDRLTWLGDIVPVPIGPGEVLSFGDLVMSVGVADVIVHLLRRRQRAELINATA
jgi:hypothetical protein